MSSTTTATLNTKPLKVGFVGLSASGWASQVLGPALLDPEVQEHFKLVAVSTTKAESATASAQKYSELLKHEIKAYHGDASQIASDPDVDFVAVAVRAQSHKDIVKKVIEAGKPFFVEWPAGRNVEETREIAALAREKGVKSFVGLQGRQSNITQKVRKIIDSGKFGKLHSVTANFLVPRELGAWGPIVKSSLDFIVDKNNGVTLLSTGVGHFLDNFVQTVGEFASVQASGTTLYRDTTVVDDATLEPIAGRPTLHNTFPDHFTITGILKGSGAWVTIVIRQGHKSTPGRRQLLWEIEGEEGSLKIEDGRVCGAIIGARDPEDVYINGEKVVWDKENDGVSKFDNPVPFVKSSWLEFAKGKENGGYYVDIEEALKHRELLDAIERSFNDNGKWIDL
ncbi:hypothetical protein MD484_g2685, partial [Candolleomyces efflorescens]